MNLVVNKNIPGFIKGLIKIYPNIILPASACAGVYHKSDKGCHAPTIAKARRLLEEKIQAVKREFS